MTSSARITSSKGNQNKWCENGKWYKVDGLGYEALSEVVVSHLLKKSTISSFVLYEYEQVEIDGKCYRACVSKDFMSADDDKVISVERLFQAKFGQSAAKEIIKYSDLIDQMKYVNEVVQSITGLTDFGSYLKEIITADALFLNEDRHFHNIAVIQKKDGTYRKCPIFDNGAALLSDVVGDYPYSLSIDQCIEKICAKPFVQDFDEQLDACESAFPEQIVSFHFSKKDIENEINQFEGIYENEVLMRTKELLYRQMRKYAYLF